jgi:hypothetical protein
MRGLAAFMPVASGATAVLVYDQPTVDLGTEAPMHQIDTPEFKAWFKGSKVVDSDGRPLVVYRGDRPGKSMFTGAEDGSVILKGNIFFAGDSKVARFYTGQRSNYMLDPEQMNEQDGLYRVFLSINYPLVLDARGEEWSQVPIPEVSPHALRDRFFRGVGQIDDIASAARDLGFDGMIVKDVGDQGGWGDQFIVFRPSQIKSATRNCGGFDSANPDIYR